MSTTAEAVPNPGRVENLALVFQEVLTAIVRLRAGRQELSDAESFRFQIREALKAAVQEARNRSSYSPDDIKMATLAMVGFLDESVLNTRNPMFADWPRKPLQEELFGIHMAGEVFFQNLDKLLARQDSADLADILEVHYLCLLLGFRGRYSIGGKAELNLVMNATADRIRRIRGVSPDPFIETAEPEVVRVAEDPWVKRLIFAAAGCAVLVLVLFVLFKIVLSSGASSLHGIASQTQG
jgi:type VI secretion system protein ImpK